MGDWQPASGTLPEEDVIVLSWCAVTRAQRLCCPEHGVTTVALLEWVGEIMGITLGGVLEMSLEAAEATGRALANVREAGQ